MANRLVVDPITRIEGHLRIEVEFDNNVISKAWAETTQFRGIETIVTGRDPRDVWAFTQRICGVCTSVHAITSINAVENAIGAQVPAQALLIRDMILSSQEIQDHVIHFYHLHALDFVNVAAIATYQGDDLPQKAVDFANSIGSKWTGNTLQRMTDVYNTVCGLVKSGQLSIFTNGYWDHPAYKLPPEADLMAVAHYLDALEFQRSMIRIGTVFGGKNPHPNFLVGGMACSIDQNSSKSVNQVQIDQIAGWVDDCVDFVNNCYVPDALAIAGVYNEYFKIGVATNNFMAVGMSGATFAGDPAASSANTPYTQVKPGVIINGDYQNWQPFDYKKVAEGVNSAWYTYDVSDELLTPDKGETNVAYTGPQPPYGEDTFLGDNDKYTWCKAPRYDGKPMQVGPVARVMLAVAQGHQPTVDLVNTATTFLQNAFGFTFTPDMLNSTAGRTLARAVESSTSADNLKTTFQTFVSNLSHGDDDVFNAAKWEPSSWPKDCSGFAFVEVARGNLSHWVSIHDGKVSHYQCVVPTTWNASGRDKEGQEGPFEASLDQTGDHPLVNPAEPLEILRTIHSFDPCMSCSVHVLDASGAELEVVSS